MVWLQMNINLRDVQSKTLQTKHTGIGLTAI